MKEKLCTAIKAIKEVKRPMELEITIGRIQALNGS